MGRRLADLFHGRRRLQVGTLLAGPIGWLVVGYLGSLVVLLVAAFWSVDALAASAQGLQRRQFKSDRRPRVRRRRVAHDPDRRSGDDHRHGPRLPIAFFMAKLASSRNKAMLVVAVLMPLWS